MFQVTFTRQTVTPGKIIGTGGGNVEQLPAQVVIETITETYDDTNQAALASLVSVAAGATPPAKLTAAQLAQEYDVSTLLSALTIKETPTT